MDDKIVCEMCGEDDQIKEYRDLIGYTFCNDCFNKHSGIKED